MFSSECLVLFYGGLLCAMTPKYGLFLFLYVVWRLISFLWLFGYIVFSFLFFLIPPCIPGHGAFRGGLGVLWLDCMY